MQIESSTDTERSLAVELVLEDIPGGGGVSTYDFPSATTEMEEGALLGVDSDGIYHLTKTAKLVNALTATSPNHIVVHNNHEFVAGDYLTNSTHTASGVLIASITASGTGADVIVYATGASGMCVAIAASGIVVAASGLGQSPLKYTPKAIATNTVSLAASGNNGCGLLVRGRVNESLLPYAVDTTIKALLPLIRFV